MSSKNITCCLFYLYMDFPVKMFHKILLTRKMLKLWRITEDYICRCCADKEEDIMHLFWYCPAVASFWQQMADWLFEEVILLPVSPLNIFGAFRMIKIHL